MVVVCVFMSKERERGKEEEKQGERAEKSRSWIILITVKI